MSLQVQKGHGSKKRPRLDCHSTIPIAKHRRDGRPLERDLFCWRVGHDFQPEKMEELYSAQNSGWGVMQMFVKVKLHICFTMVVKQGLGMEHLGNL